MKQSEVSVIILNYNGLRDTVECLDSLKKVTYSNYKVILVDNNSTSYEAKALKDRYGNSVHIIENGQNFGFIKGNNIGIAYARKNYGPEYYLLLNNDTRVDPEFITELVKVAQSNPAIGATVAKIYLYDKPGHIESTGLKINMWRGQSYRLNWRRKDKGQYEQTKEVDAASTNAFLLKREAEESVGHFNETFFIYHDDVDYCIRLRKAGYKTVYVPKAKIWHKVGKAARKTIGLPYYYLARNNFRFMREHATKWQYRSFIAYLFLFHLWLMTAAYLVYFRRLKILTSYYRGIKDGLLDYEGGFNRGE